MIDAHVHLWQKQEGCVNGLPVYGLGNGRSMFGAEVRQMLPPYMTDGVNSAERLLSCMDFAQVAGAVVTQEYIDGNQDAYLRQVRVAHPDRFRITALYEEKGVPDTSGVDGIKICGGRLDMPMRPGRIYSSPSIWRTVIGKPRPCGKWPGSIPAFALPLAISAW